MNPKLQFLLHPRHHPHHRQELVFPSLSAPSVLTYSSISKQMENQERIVRISQPFSRKNIYEWSTMVLGRSRGRPSKPLDPLREEHFPSEYIQGFSRTYRDISFAHTPLPVNIVLAHDLITVTHSLAALQPEILTRLGVLTPFGEYVGFCIWISQVDSEACVVLRPSIW